jgi:hypothetical protein
MYTGDAVDAEGESVPAFIVPATEPLAFIESNFPDLVELEPGLWLSRGEESTYLHPFKAHVLISTSESMARGYVSKSGMAATFREAVDARVLSFVDQADILVWARGETIGDLFGTAARGAPLDLPFGQDPAVLGALSADLLYGVILFDFDPLGLSVRTFMEYAPGSTMDGFGQGGPGSGLMMGRLPDNPYYFALSMDLSGLGGFKAFQNLLGLASVSGDALPDRIREGQLGLEQLQFAAYPSRLGIALGGLLNDSALVVSARDPEAVEATLRETLLGLKGDRGGVRYDPEWVDEKPLRTGGVSDAFRLKETVLPPSKGANMPDTATSAFQRIALQLIWGSRGLSGFAGVEGDDAFVMTFSQRPDVWNRAIEASSGTGGTIAESAVLRSMRPWLVEEPDVEVLIGMGTLSKLLEQLGRAIPMINPEMFPSIPGNTPPIAFNLSVDKGLYETATVLPTGVIALAFDQVMEGLTQGFRGGDVEE